MAIIKCKMCGGDIDLAAVAVDLNRQAPTGITEQENIKSPNTP